MDTQSTMPLFEPSLRFIESIPIGFARRFLIIGLRSTDDDFMNIAICDKGGRDCLDAVGRYLGIFVNPISATKEDILAAINHAYQQRDNQSLELLESLQTRTGLIELQEFAKREDLLETDDKAPVIQLVNTILFEAAKSRASDVHIQPYEDIRRLLLQACSHLLRSVVLRFYSCS